MANSIRIKTVPVAGGIEVRALINHPMSRGQRDKASGKCTNAHYVEEVVVALNGKTIVQGDWSSGISATPTSCSRCAARCPATSCGSVGKTTRAPRILTRSR